MRNESGPASTTQPSTCSVTSTPPKRDWLRRSRIPEIRPPDGVLPTRKPRPGRRFRRRQWRCVSCRFFDATEYDDGGRGPPSFISHVAIGDPICDRAKSAKAAVKSGESFNESPRQSRMPSLLCKLLEPDVDVVQNLDMVAEKSDGLHEHAAMTGLLSNLRSCFRLWVQAMRRPTYPGSGRQMPNPRARGLPPAPPASPFPWSAPHKDRLPQSCAAEHCAP